MLWGPTAALWRCRWHQIGVGPCMLGDQIGMLAQAIAGTFDVDDDSMVK
ncbi:hypothetical protein KRIGEM_02942 (plasmid) [Komagataeibacter rhaeticus]|nr:hypothetical protein KRIGEM_03198 [Komagataeibacter rhaeticus]SAY49953.1 hypothetical protein KRIGEM_02942 [Komagataeibacter rhaeticus]